jgi:hypothetical protein
MIRRTHLAAALMLATTACGGAEGPSAPPLAPRSPGYPQPGHLIPLLTLANPRLPQTAALIAKTGYPAEKEAAGRQLASLANTVASEAWRQQQLPVLARMHPEPLSEGRRRRLLDDLQRRRQVRIYEAMSALGGETVLDHCLAVSKSDERHPNEQQLALSVLANHGRAEVGPSPVASQWGMPSGPPAPGTGPATTFGPPSSSPWTAPPTPGAPQAVAAPAEAPRVEGGEIINVNEVVDKLRPYFIICYQRALAQYGRFGAWIILEADVSANNGKVFEVSGKGDDSVPPSMMQCLYDVVRQAQFAPPRGGDARVSIPLTFTQG